MSSLRHRLARGWCFCHTHVLTNLHSVPIAKLTHMPHGFGQPAVHLMAQTAAIVAHFSLFFHVLEWGGVRIHIWGYCCTVNRQIWWLRWQSWPDEDCYSSFSCGWRKWMEPTKQWLLLANMLPASSLSLFSCNHGIFCDMLENLPSISAPYLYICFIIWMLLLSSHVVLLVERSVYISCMFSYECGCFGVWLDDIPKAIWRGTVYYFHDPCF